MINQDSKSTRLFKNVAIRGVFCEKSCKKSKKSSTQYFRRFCNLTPLFVELPNVGVELQGKSVHRILLSFILIGTRYI